MCIESTFRDKTNLGTPKGKLQEAQLNLCEVFSIYIFDWDDTLLPTSALIALGPEQMKDALTEADVLASQILRSALATTNSHVMLLTNANISWLRQSAADFLPNVHAILETEHTNLSIVSAHLPRGQDPEHDNATPEEVVRRKITVARTHASRFQAILNDYGLAKFQIISVGDGPQDLEAGRVLASALHADESHVKTVAMKMRPHQMELIGELRALCKALPVLCRVARSVHQSMFRSPTPTQVAATDNAKSMNKVASAPTPVRAWQQMARLGQV